jgi:hypothetical protein
VGDMAPVSCRYVRVGQVGELRTPGRGRSRVLSAAAGRQPFTRSRTARLCPKSSIAMRVLANILAYVAFVHCTDHPVLLRSGPRPPSLARRYARTKSAHRVRGLLRVSSDQAPGPRSWPRLAWQWRRARWARCVLMLLSWPRSSDHPGCRGQARTVRRRCRRHNGYTSLRTPQQRSCRSRRPPHCLPGGAVRLARPQTRAEPGTPLSGPHPPAE